MTPEERARAWWDAMVTGEQPASMEDVERELLRLAAEFRAVAAEAAKYMSRERDEAIEILEDTVNQSCSRSDNDDGMGVAPYVLDSYALSSYRDALKFLAKVGRIKISHEAGRRIIGHWLKPEIPANE